MKTWKLLSAMLVAVLFLGSTIIPVHSQQSVEFKNYEVKTTFLENMRFTVEVCGVPKGTHALLNVRLSHEAWWSTSTFTGDAETPSCVLIRYTYDMKDYPPFISVEYFWQVNVKGKGFYESPKQFAMYEDTRFQWDEMQSGNITVYSHDRTPRFEQRVLEISTEADQAQRPFYGLELKYPYRIVIFNSDEEFFAWNVISSDYVAGESYPDYDLTVQIVEDDSEDWLNEVIPHEISHLYFHQAADHPKPKSYPPNWLNEGLAVYNEFGSHSFEDRLVREAVANSNIIPLYEIANSFGDDPDRVDLAYAEGYSAVSYWIETYGRDPLKTLLNTYRNGKGTDEAFERAIQKTSLEFEADWENWLKEKYSNQPPSLVTEVAPIQRQPVPFDSTSLLGFTLCILGFVPVVCILVVASMTMVALVLKRAKKF